MYYGDCDIGASLRAIRKKHKLTQAQLGKALGVSAATIANYENNKTVPKIEIIMKFSNLFNITTDMAMGRFGTPEQLIALLLQGINPDRK